MDVVFFSFIYLHFDGRFAVWHFAKDHFRALWYLPHSFWSVDVLNFVIMVSLLCFSLKSGVRWWLLRLLDRRFNNPGSRWWCHIFCRITIATFFQNTNSMWTNFHVLNTKVVLHVLTLIRLFFPIDTGFLLIWLDQVVLWLILSNFNLALSLPLANKFWKMLSFGTLKVSLAFFSFNFPSHLPELWFLLPLIDLLHLKLAVKWHLR